MQGLAEKPQRGEITGAVRSDLRGETPAHRFATDRQLTGARGDPASHGLNDGAPAAFQPRVRIGNATAVLAVRKVEGDDIDPAVRQRGSEDDHEAARLVGSPPM